jgi:hypothetical protein
VLLDPVVKPAREETPIPVFEDALVKVKLPASTPKNVFRDPKLCKNGSVPLYNTPVFEFKVFSNLRVLRMFTCPVFWLKLK